VAYAIHEFQRLGFLPLTRTAWNTNSFLSERAGVGSFPKSLFGYDADPSILKVLVYAIYLSVISPFFKSRSRTVTVEAVS